MSLDPLTLSPKLPKEVTDIFLGNKGLTVIHPNFVQLVNLEVLWLNDNKISRIDNLIPNNHEDLHKQSVMNKKKALGCTRLRELYLHQNRITEIPPELRKIKFLRTLSLHHNRLRNLDAVLEQLKHFQFLEQLDLFENPVANEKLYKERVLVTFPKLHVFDRHVIDDDERATAKKIMRAITLKEKQKTFKESVGGTSSPKREQKKVKIVFGKALKNAKALQNIEKVNDYSPSVTLLWRECMQAKSRLELDDPYNKSQIETDYQQALSQIRSSLPCSQEAVEQQHVQKWVSDYAWQSLLTNAQISFLTNYDASEASNIFPGSANDLPLSSFIPLLCQVNLKQLDDQLVAIEKERQQAEAAVDEVDDKKKKPAKKAAAVEETQVNPFDVQKKEIQSQRRRWLAVEGYFFDFMKTLALKKKKTTQKKNKTRRDLFYGITM
mmetsp:Transcript_7459/g.11044  ORF Transcript_7459/g.11044 Transcript_7459/m.11044 type:complete len:437 (+) Transcript_7459:726-2036(+)